MYETSAPMTLPAELEAGPPNSALWMEGRLIADLMASAREGQLILAAVIPLFVAVLYQYVWLPGLIAWTLGTIAVTGYRLYAMGLYKRDFINAPSERQVEFLRRYGFTWPLSAFVWALSGFLHFEHAPVYSQFLCWLTLTGIGTFAAMSFASSLDTMRSYINVLAITCLLPIVWEMGYRWGFMAPLYYYAMLALVLAYWAILLRTGTRHHYTLRASVRLQQANAELIRSLRQQTRTALDAVQAKNRFIASAAHDLRQPVHALSLYADWLHNEPHLAPELAPRIMQSTKAVNELFDALFDLVRLDSGKIKPDWQEVRLDELARELIMQHTPLATTQGIELRLRAPPLYAWSDPIMLRRILGNLLSNAVKHTAHGGVLLALRPHGQTVRLEVWDTGAGIAAEHQQMIFKEFYRVPLHQGTAEGFGLGLSIVSRLAVALGHPLGLQSRVRRGTVFRLTLPLARLG